MWMGRSKKDRAVPSLDQIKKMVIEKKLPIQEVCVLLDTTRGTINKILEDNGLVLPLRSKKINSSWNKTIKKV
jgi:predicted subunit of tRNA(5-methylaminomethyl-2-thiouridylate) methyltransferase